MDQVRRPRFKPPLVRDKIRMEAAKWDIFETLESAVSAMPVDIPAGPVIGEGAGEMEPSRSLVGTAAVPARPVTAAALPAAPVTAAALPAAPVTAAALPAAPVTAAVLPARPVTAAAVPAASVAASLPAAPVTTAVTADALPAAPVAAGSDSGVALIESRLRPVIDRDTAELKLPKGKYFIPSNRRAFKQFIIQAYNKYKLPPVPSQPNPDACKNARASSKEVKTFQYQAFVRDYIQRPTPYRGVLVYHGLGSGKTCTSIASLEVLYNRGQKPIYVFTPAALSKNYRDEITKCGPFIFRPNNHWKWIAVPNMKIRTRESEFLINVMGIPVEILRRQRGAWVPDPTQSSNFDQLKIEEQRMIMDQIYRHIDYRYIFINYNGLQEGTVRNWACNNPTMFDGATIIIDEVHNLIRTINNSNLEGAYKDEPRNDANFMPKYCAAGRKYRISYLVYRMLCNAVGCKIIALSGTPIINYPQEIAILANLLAGDTRMVETTIPLGSKAKDAQIMDYLQRHPEVDFAEIIPQSHISKSLVRMTLIPSGCRKVIDEATGAFRGLVRDETLVGETTEIMRERDIAGWFERVRAGIDVPMSAPKMLGIERLPDLEKPFRDMFVDTEKLEVKSTMKLALMARLSGLISYYKGGKADLMARVTTDEIVPVDMSDLQLKEYTGMRKEEITKEQKESKRTKPAQGDAPGSMNPTLYDLVLKKQSSTFKIFSRAACNFAFPSDMDRPRPADFREAVRGLGLAEEDKAAAAASALAAEGAEGVPEPTDEIMVEQGARVTAYELAIRTALAELRNRGLDVFGKDVLPTYSPKFQAMMDRMDASRGPVLVYSQFKAVEGITLFGMALENQKGFKKFDVEPDGSGGWRLTKETLESGPGTFRYATYTGDEKAEKRDILKAVFNAAWNKIPAALAEQVKQLAGVDNNFKGEIIRAIMITQSGAEGISLANVRQVHIMEPYWNYVRLEQVKGRAIRICSHEDLPYEERTVDVYTYISCFSQKQIETRMVDETLLNFDRGLTTDQSILQLSSAKKKLADSLFEVMQASAVDCELNATENGAVACFRLSGSASMEPLFHPLITAHAASAEGLFRALAA
jgi:hypothetical protein